MSRAELQEPTTDFGRRLDRAIREEKLTRSAMARETKLGGRFFRLLGIGKDPIESPGPGVIKLLALKLRVSYEWLAIGQGPMRVEGWAPTTLETATLFAARDGLREDAIAAASARLEGARLTAVDWVVAFDAEARRLDREGIAAPASSATRAKERKRLLKELAKLDAHDAGQSPPTSPARRPRRRAERT